MAITVTLDLFEGSQVETGNGGERFLRRGFVEGIDVTGAGGDKSEAMFLAREAVIAECIAQPLKPSRAHLLISRVFLHAVSDTQAQAQILYESPSGGGFTPSTYILTDDSFLSSYETYTLPDTYEEIRVAWYDPAAGPPTGDEEDFFVDAVPPDNILFSFMRPIRRLSVAALIYGEPGTEGLDEIGTVNHANWPTVSRPGKPKGYWQLERWRTSYSKYQGYHTLEASALTMVKSPWSFYGTLRNQRTGRYVKIDAVEKAGAVAAAYSRGIHAYNGFVRVDPYYTSNFATLFKF